VFKINIVYINHKCLDFTILSSYLFRLIRIALFFILKIAKDCQSRTNLKIKARFIFQTVYAYAIRIEYFYIFTMVLREKC
jgi:hypothetical protein